MAKVLINGKEHNCSQSLKEDIEWIDIKILTVRNIAQKIEDKQDEIDTFVTKKQSEIQDLINQLRNI